MVKYIKDQGFSLIEVMIVLAIIAILAISAVPASALVREIVKEAGCEHMRHGMVRGLNLYLDDDSDWVPGSLGATPKDEIIAMKKVSTNMDCPSLGQYYWVELEENVYELYCTVHTKDLALPLGDKVAEGMYNHTDLGGTSIEKFEFLRSPLVDGQTLKNFITEAKFTDLMLADNQSVGLVYRITPGCNEHNVRGSAFIVKKEVVGPETKYYACFTPILSGHINESDPSVQRVQITGDLALKVASGKVKMTVVARDNEQEFYLNGKKVMSVENEYQINNGDAGLVSSRNTNTFNVPQMSINKLPW